MPQQALDPGTASVTVSIRVPKAVKANYKRLAKSSGRSLSQWMRETLDGGATLPRGSVAQTAPPPPKKPKHEHAVVGMAMVYGRGEVPKCECGAIQVNGRWV